MTEKENAIYVAQQLYERKAQNILVLNVAHMTVLTDYLVIASGLNALQVKALAEHLDFKTQERGMELRRIEGMADGKWVVMDFNGIIVHIFSRPERDYYRLERLWSDGTNQVSLPFDDSKDETLS